MFDGVMPNPTVGNVNAGAKVARENGCDFLVALGGGSVMDCTKGIALMATNEGELWDYVPIGLAKDNRLREAAAHHCHHHYRRNRFGN